MTQAADTAVTVGTKVTSAMTHGGAGFTILGGLTMNELAVAVGILVSVLGLLGNWIITWYWKSKHFKLEVQRIEFDRRQVNLPACLERRRHGDCPDE